MLKLKRFSFYLFTFLALLLVLVSCFRSNSPRQNADDAIDTPLTTQSLVTKLLPTSYVTTSGGDESQPISNVHVKDQSGDDNDYYKYLELQTPQGNNYAGYRTFILPQHITPSAITTLQLTINFLGPAPDEQQWTWSIYNWTTSTWVTLGNNTGASWDGWKEFNYNATGTLSNYVGGNNNNELRIQIASNNAVDNADIDYEAITVTGGTTPTEVTLHPDSYTTTNGSDDGQPVSNLYVKDQSGNDNEWQRYVELKTSQTNYAGYRSYILPDYIETTDLATLQLQANFLGPAPVEQQWTWSIYNWTTSTWVTLGNNRGASWDGWKEFNYDAAGTLTDYVGGNNNNEIRIQLASNNAVDDADVDYEAIVVTVDNTPTTTITMARSHFRQW